VGLNQPPQPPIDTSISFEAVYSVPVPLSLPTIVTTAVCLILILKSYSMIAPAGIENTQDKHLGFASWKSATDSRSNFDLIVIGIDPPFSASLGALNDNLSLFFNPALP